MSAVLASCTTRSQKAVEIQPAKLPTGNVTPGTGSGAEVPITLPEEEMKKYGDTANMNYKFSYLAYNESKAIVFNNGSAQIKIVGLPAGQAGTVVLEIYEGAVLKLRGEQANVTLGVGVNNSIGLHLAPPTGGAGGVNPSGGNGKTDLTIDVSFDNGSGTQQSGVITPPSGGTGTTNPGNGGGTGSTGGTVDPIAGWDGKSFLGNSKWTIVPVNG